MNSERLRKLPREYVLRNGDSMRYDPDKHLLPDRVSEILGAVELPRMISQYRSSAGDPEKPVRILIPGIGPGTLASGLISGLELDDPSRTSAKNVNIDAFDINPDAVVTAQANIDEQLQNKWGEDGPVTFRVFQGDWKGGAVWDTLREEDSYTHVIVNPPYAFRDDFREQVLLPGYDTVPENALYGRRNGGEHYYVLAQELQTVLSEESDAGVIFRFSDSNFATSSVPRIVDRYFADEDFTKEFHSELFDTASERWGAFARIRRK